MLFNKWSFPQIILHTLQFMCALKVALWKVVDAINQMKLRGFWAQPCDGLWELCKSRPWQVTINHLHHRHHNHYHHHRLGHRHHHHYSGLEMDCRCCTKQALARLRRRNGIGKPTRAQQFNSEIRFFQVESEILFLHSHEMIWNMTSEALIYKNILSCGILWPL